MKLLHFLFILPFVLSAQCHGSSKEDRDISQDQEYGTVRTMAAHKFMLNFVHKHAPGAQSCEDALESIFRSSGSFRGISYEELLNHTRAWLEERKTDADVGHTEQETLQQITADNLSPELHQRIYQFSHAQSVLRAVFEAQWKTWMQTLGSQEPGAFAHAFVTAYPGALPQQLEDFTFFMGSTRFKECDPALKPHALVTAPLSASLEGLEDVHHLVAQDIAWGSDLFSSAHIKGAHLKEIGAFQNLRSLSITRDASYFTKNAQPWPLLEILKEILPKLTRLETLQLPVLTADEEAQARDLLSECGQLKRVILSSLTKQARGKQKKLALNPQPLFDAMPEHVETFLREDDARRGGTWSNVPVSGGIYPYIGGHKSPVNIAPNFRPLSEGGVNGALVTMVISHGQNQ